MQSSMFIGTAAGSSSSMSAQVKIGGDENNSKKRNFMQCKSKAIATERQNIYLLTNLSLFV